MPPEREIGESFYEPLGRIVIKFACLDDCIAMAVFTLSNPNPVSQPTSQVTSIGGAMEQNVWRLIISGTTIEQRVEMLRRIAKHRFPSRTADIDNLYKDLKKVIEIRNELMHHGWHGAGQIGFNRHGVPQVNERSVEELTDIGNQIASLNQRVTWLHENLLELYSSEH